MGKTWGIFFAVNMLACAAICVVAPAMGWWMPEGVSTHAESVDFLFNIILAITTFFFFLTEAILVVFLWKYGSAEGAVLGEVAPPAAAPAGGMPGFLKPVAGLINTQHKVEVAWTIVPAAILLYIAFAQISAWANIKYQSRLGQFVGDKPLIEVELSARQFEWRFRYPSAERTKDWVNDINRKNFAKKPQADDVHVVNELHVVKDNPVLVHLSTRDVLHSFNLPQFRVKQDALPGKVIPVWFTPTKSNVVKVKGAGGQYVWQDGKGRDEDGHPIDRLLVWDIPCAELCGWGHYRMVGRVYVHPDQEDFLAWLEQTGKSEHGRVATK